jgi:hypothetical protein
MVANEQVARLGSGAAFQTLEGIESAVIISSNGFPGFFDLNAGRPYGGPSPFFAKKSQLRAFFM